MKMLLTGGSGFVGKHIKEFFQQDNSLSILGRNSNADLKYDITDYIPSFDSKFNLVVHNAGRVHLVPKTTSELNSFFKVNHIGTLNLLKALEESPPDNFILISTVAVYGLASGININEEYPLAAVDPYGKSKILAEKSVLEWCKKYGVKCTILRLPLVVGKNAPGNFRAMVNGIKKGYYFNVNGGKARKSMLLVSDIPPVIQKAIGIEGAFNLSDGINPSFWEISNVIASCLGKQRSYSMPMVIAQISAKIGDILGDRFPINSLKLNKLTEDLTFDNTKARQAFNWNPTPVLDNIEL
jgi:nucleoside-diphosphate-sugar epimerase